MKAYHRIIFEGCSLTIGVVLLFAAILKSIDLVSFQTTLRLISWLPTFWVQELVWIVPSIEILLAFCLLGNVYRLKAMFASLVVLIGFSIFLAINLTDPYAPACRCIGWIEFSHSNWTNNLIALIRNVFLLMVAAAGLWAGPGLMTSRESLQDPVILIRSSAFTLIELLVVLGVLSILIAILVPVFASVRRASWLTQCAVTQREYGTLIHSRAASNRGDTFIAGQLGFANDVSLTQHLGDPDKRRYLYRTTAEAGLAELRPFTQLLPFPFCLTDVTRALPVIVLQNEVPKDVSRLRCPNLVFDGEFQAEAFISYQQNETAWRALTGYALNGAIFAFNSDNPETNALRGKILQVKRPSDTLLLGDANNRPAVNSTSVWFPRGVGVPNATLRDATAQPASPRFDLMRHRGKANTLMTDGHVRTAGTIQEFNAIRLVSK